MNQNIYVSPNPSHLLRAPQAGQEGGKTSWQKLFFDRCLLGALKPFTQNYFKSKLCMGDTPHSFKDQNWEHYSPCLPAQFDNLITAYVNTFHICLPLYLIAGNCLCRKDDNRWAELDHCVLTKDVKILLWQKVEMLEKLPCWLIRVCCLFLLILSKFLFNCLFLFPLV